MTASYRLLAFFFFLTAGLSLRAQTSEPDFKDPVVYNDYIVDQQNKIGEKILAFVALIQEGGTEASMREGYKVLLTQVDAAVKEVSAMPAFANKTRLRDSAADLFGFYHSIVASEYKEIMEIMIKTEQNEADYARLNEIMEAVTAREAGYDEAFQAAQEEFAKENNIILEENELEKEFGGSEKE